MTNQKIILEIIQLFNHSLLNELYVDGGVVRIRLNVDRGFKIMTAQT